MVNKYGLGWGWGWCGWVNYYYFYYFNKFLFNGAFSTFSANVTFKLKNQAEK